MKIHKKSLLVLYCSFANIFPLFAENEEIPADLNYSIEASPADESESEYPTYAKLHLGYGWGSKFNYITKARVGGVEVENPKKGECEKNTEFKRVGFELGKVIDNWNLGFEASLFLGNIGECKDGNEGYISGDINIGSFICNAYYNLHFDDTDAYLTFGAGFGFDYVSLKPKYSTSVRDLKVETHSHSCFVPAGQLYAGLGYAFTDSLNATLGYKFHKIFKSIEWESSTMPIVGGACKTVSEWKSPSIHLIELSLMYQF